MIYYYDGLPLIKTTQSSFLWLGKSDLNLKDEINAD